MKFGTQNSKFAVFFSAVWAVWAAWAVWAVVPYTIDEMSENNHPAFLAWKQNAEKFIVKTPIMREEDS